MRLTRLTPCGPARPPPRPKAPPPSRLRAEIHHLALRLTAPELDRLAALCDADDGSTLSVAAGPVSLLRALRATPAGVPVCLHTLPGAGLSTLWATIILRRRGHTVLHWARGPVPPAEAAGLAGRAAGLARSRAAALGETPEDVARLGSAGAEAWLAPFVSLPTADERRTARAAWELPAAAPVVLFAGPLDGPLAAALAALPDSGGVAVAGWGPGAAPAGLPHVSAPTTGSGLPAATAAADVLVLTAGHAYAPRLDALAAQVGTAVVTLAEDTGATDAAQAITAALASATPAPGVPAEAAGALQRLATRAGTPRAVVPPGTRPDVAVLAWTNSLGRTMEMAHALGGEGRTFYDLNLTDKRLIPIRYALSSLRMAAYLVRRRPRVVVVANPPIVPPVIAFAYRLVTRAPLLLDSQTASFGEKGSGLGRAMLPVHKAISRRSTVTLVGAEGLAQRVREWGAQPMIFYEAPPMWQIAPPRPRGPVLRVLWIGVFAGDEPLDALLGAAALMPDVEFRITGDLRRAPADRDAAPPNVVWLGFVRGGAFPAEIEDADVVVTMTTDPGSALRGGAEAAFAERPLVTTDVPFLRDLFPEAYHAANDAEGVRDALRRIDGDWEAARAAARRGVEVQQAGWAPQLRELRHWCGQPGGEPPA